MEDLPGGALHGVVGEGTGEDLFVLGPFRLEVFAGFSEPLLPFLLQPGLLHPTGGGEFCLAALQFLMALFDVRQQGEDLIQATGAFGRTPQGLALFPQLGQLAFLLCQLRLLRRHLLQLRLAHGFLRLVQAHRLRQPAPVLLQRTFERRIAPTKEHELALGLAARVLKPPEQRLLRCILRHPFPDAAMQLTRQIPGPVVLPQRMEQESGEHAVARQPGIHHRLHPARRQRQPAPMLEAASHVGVVDHRRSLPMTAEEIPGEAGITDQEHMPRATRLEVILHHRVGQPGRRGPVGVPGGVRHCIHRDPRPRLRPRIDVSVASKVDDHGIVRTGLVHQSCQLRDDRLPGGLAIGQGPDAFKPVIAAEQFGQFHRTRHRRLQGRPLVVAIDADAQEQETTHPRQGFPRDHLARQIA